MTRIRQTDGSAKGFPRVPATDYGTMETGGSRSGSPVLNEAQLIQRNFKLTGTLPPQVNYAAFAQFMVEKAYQHTFCVTPGGRVFAAGGYTVAWHSGATAGLSLKAQYYDPSTGLWTALNDLPETARKNTACAIDDSAVIVGGGVDQANAAFRNGWYRYDLGTGARVSVPGGPQRTECGAIKVADGRIIVFGGYTNTADTAASNGVFAFNPSTNGWSTLTSMPVSIGRVVAAPLPDGRVLIAGRTTAPAFVFAIFDPTTNATTSITGPANNETSAQYVHLIPRKDGKVYAFMGSTGYLSVYDPVAQSWATLATAPVVAAGPQGSVRFTPVALTTSNKLVMCNPSGGALTVRVYDPVANAWSTVYTAPTPTNWLSFVAPLHAALPDGRTLLFGAYRSGGASSDALTTTLIFNPSTNVYALPTSPAPITDHTPSVSVKANGSAFRLYGLAQWVPGITGVWKRNGVQIGAGASYDYTPAANHNGSNLTFEVSSSLGTVASPNIPVTILPNDIGIDWVSTGNTFQAATSSGMGGDTAATDGVSTIWAVAYDGSQFRLHRSVDNGQSFALAWSPGAGVTINGVVFGAGKFVIYGYGSDNFRRIWTADVGGTAVTQRWIASASGGTITHAFFDGTSFYATDIGWKRLTSSDGVSWTEADATAGMTGSWVYGMAKLASGRYIATTSDHKVWTSDDLDTWTLRFTATNTIFSLAVSPDGTRAMFSRGSADTARYSTDNGVTWVAYGVNLGRFAVGEGKVFAAMPGVMPAVSADNGATWTFGTSNPLSNHPSLTYSNGRLIALGAAFNNTYVSP
jgi:N-acetylneuraminic acid mutarotase